MPPIDYTKKATESIDQYNARISGARGYSVQANPTGVSTTTNLKTGVITPADLGSANPITPNIPAPTETPVVPDVPPPVTTETPTPEATPTPFADQISKLLGEAQAGNTAMVGKASDTAALNESQGVNAKTDVINSLSSQLTGLINESKAIPLQIQQSAQEGGANVTKGGLAPIQTASLRNNAIRSLSVSSQIDAARGDLASAMSKVDRAIAAKYGPLEEAQKARLANLELLSKDPRLSRENEKRIEEAKAREAAKAEKLKTEKENDATKQALILQAVQNGAPAAVLKLMGDAKDVIGAATAGAGWTSKETATSIQEYNFAVRGGYKGSYSQYQNEDANRKAQIARAGVANGEFGLSQGQANLFNNIVTKYNASPLIAAADRTIVLKNSIEQARKNPSDGATQLNLVYSYIQALDTYQSAVREGELGLVNSIDSKVGKLSNYVEQVQNGQIIRPEVAKQIADAAENLVNTINQGAKSKAKSYASQAETLGLGEPWKKYQSGFQSSFADITPQSKVEQAVQSSGKSYQEIISGAPAGQVAVLDGETGEMFYVPVEEIKSTDIRM